MARFGVRVVKCVWSKSVVAFLNPERYAKIKSRLLEDGARITTFLFDEAHTYVEWDYGRFADCVKANATIAGFCTTKTKKAFRFAFDDAVAPFPAKSKPKLEYSSNQPSPTRESARTKDATR